MKLKVLAYEKEECAHRCIDEKGDRHLVDFYLNNDEPLNEIEPEDLVGKIVECKELGIYIEVAVLAEVVDGGITLEDLREGTL